VVGFPGVVSLRVSPSSFPDDGVSNQPSAVHHTMGRNAARGYEPNEAFVYVGQRTGIQQRDDQTMDVIRAPSRARSGVIDVVSSTGR
jgi:hypothetical protein